MQYVLLGRLAGLNLSSSRRILPSFILISS
jgi:hypothetical protein